jgi:predicted O-methyltransferase YrrM
MRGSKDQTQDPISHYVETLTAPLSPTLLKITEQLQKDNKWGINIGVVEGRILQFFIHSMQIKKVLEIGTQYGYSTQWMLEALPEEGSLTTIEKDPLHHKMAQSFIHDPRCRWMLGDARDLLKSLDSETFDLIFIDANKKAYPEYLEWAEKHLRVGGLVIGDNTFLFGKVFEGQEAEAHQAGMQKSMRLFNERLMTSPNLKACIIPTSEGLTVACKIKPT